MTWVATPELRFVVRYKNPYSAIPSRVLQQRWVNTDDAYVPPLPDEWRDVPEVWEER